ncbi:protein of unknown function [Ruminococcaceae bacterium BL-6]|nr:protein of unknown function [Ruminococcaceae bacterium BL-6]
MGGFYRHPIRFKVKINKNITEPVCCAMGNEGHGCTQEKRLSHQNPPVCSLMVYNIVAFLGESRKIFRKTNASAGITAKIARKSFFAALKNTGRDVIIKLFPEKTAAEQFVRRIMNEKPPLTANYFGRRWLNYEQTSKSAH